MQMCKTGNGEPLIGESGCFLLNRSRPQAFCGKTDTFVLRVSEYSFETADGKVFSRSKTKLGSVVSCVLNVHVFAPVSIATAPLQ